MDKRDCGSRRTDRKGPTFIGIGGHKCASTWLSECLRDHPDVFVTNPKETGFFVYHMEKGIQWYTAHFNGSEGYAARGEFTSYYLYDRSVSQNVRETLGSLHVIAVVRDPVERALSQIKHGIRLGVCSPSSSGVISLSDLHAMIEQYKVILNRSLYYEGLSAWIEAFGESNILVLDQGDFRSHPEQCLQQMYRFIGVDDGFVPSRVRKDVSRGINPRWKVLERLRISIYGRARSIPGVVPLVRKSRLPEVYRRINSGRSLGLSSEAAAWIREHTQDDWAKTQKTCWKPNRNA
jgi:hypothetical protein